MLYYVVCGVHLAHEADQVFHGLARAAAHEMCKMEHNQQIARMQPGVSVNRNTRCTLAPSLYRQ